MLWQLSSMASLGNPSKLRLNITRKCSTKSNVLDHQNQQQRLLIEGQTSEHQHLVTVAISRVSSCVTICKKFFGKSGYWLAKPCYSRWVGRPESSSHSNFQMQPIAVIEEWIRFLVPRLSPCKYIQWLFQIWYVSWSRSQKQTPGTLQTILHIPIHGTRPLALGVFCVAAKIVETWRNSFLVKWTINFEQHNSRVLC